MTKEKKFKASVRELAARLGVAYQTAHTLMSRKFYRARLIVAAHDGLVIDDKVVNLSSFPKTGDFVRLDNGSWFHVWHPILKAHTKPESVEADLPSVCVHPVPKGGPTTVVEVPAMGERMMPVLMDLWSDNAPRSVRRYVTRPYAEGDGIDIELPDEFGTRMHGHHVYRTPSGLYLKREMLDVEYGPYRIRLPARDPSHGEGFDAPPPA